MNDTELDELLDQWQTPPLRNAVRENLRSGFAASQKRAHYVGLLPRIRLNRIAVAAVAAAALLFAIIQVSPQTIRLASPDFRIPYYVEFEFTRYANDGSAPYPTRITSFPYAGHEILMSVTPPGHTVLGRIRGLADAIRTRFILAVPSFVLPREPPMKEPAWFAGFVNSGCSEGKTVLGHETLAGHQTTVVESVSPGNRIRIWMAPDLACFALKLTYEVQEANGAYRLKMLKEAVEVTMNP